MEVARPFVHGGANPIEFFSILKTPGTSNVITPAIAITKKNKEYFVL